MASSLSTISISFLPQPLARYNKNNESSRKTNPKKLPPNLNLRHKSRSFLSLSLSSISGGEATTYTRLPPKDDFFITLVESPSQSATEVKLSDFSIAQFSIQKSYVNDIEDEVGEFSSEFNLKNKHNIDDGQDLFGSRRRQVFSVVNGGQDLAVAKI